MAKIRQSYKCSECGAQTAQWLGQCPGCREWNTLELVREPISASGQIQSAAVSLCDVSDSAIQPYSCGIPSLDRVLGSGIVPGAAILVGGEPGIGKSTLLLQTAMNVSASGRKALYASGEESLGQIQKRGERLGRLSPNLLAVATSKVEDIMDAVRSHSPALLIADSVQTFMYSEEQGIPGNITQVKAVASALVDCCRKAGCALILVGHVTKDGTLAGPRLLEHMVDTVISLEGDRRQMFRLLRIFKNRFGPTEELLVFRMGSKGMEIVPDPSTFFLGARDPGLSGAALCMSIDGHRPLAVEVQALVARSYLNIPRRMAVGFDVSRLHLLLAVLEKRIGLNLGQVDIYAKVGGGLRLQEPGLDLAIVAACLSSYYDTPLPEKSIFWGEVDLNGQARPAAGQEARLAQSRRLGFEPIVYPAQSIKKAGNGDGIRDIMELQRKLFRKK